MTVVMLYSERTHFSGVRGEEQGSIVAALAAALAAAFAKAFAEARYIDLLGRQH